MFLIILLPVIVLLTFCLLLCDIWNKTKIEYKIHKKFPSEKCYFLIGTLKSFFFLNQEQAFEWLRNSTKKFKTSYTMWAWGQLMLNIINAKDAEIILSSTRCTEKSFHYTFLQPFIGTGLLSSGSTKWKQRRKILTPPFHFCILKQFQKIFLEHSNQVIENMKINTNKCKNVESLISPLVLNTICETAMGVKLSPGIEADNYHKRIKAVGEVFLNRILRPWLYSSILYRILGKQTKFQKFIRPIHKFNDGVIKKRQHMLSENNISTESNNDENIYITKKQRYSMLDTLLVAEAKGEAIDNEGVREEVNTFLFAGHETTSITLTFILLMLAENVEIQNEVYEEIVQYSKSITNPEFEMNDLNNLKLLDRVIKESMRLFPAVPFISRNLSEDTKFNGLILPAGTLIQLHIFDIHRDPKQYPDPERFDPDRFFPENLAKRHPYSFIPFSAGPRNCIGQKYALLLMKTILSKILLKYKLEQITKRSEIIFVADVVLRSKSPIYIKFDFR